MTEHNTLTGLASDASVDHDKLLDGFAETLGAALRYLWADYKINPEYTYARNDWAAEWEEEHELIAVAFVAIRLPRTAGVNLWFTLRVQGTLVNGAWALRGELYPEWGHIIPCQDAVTVIYMPDYCRWVDADDMKFGITGVNPFDM